MATVNVVPEDIMYDLDFKMMCNTVSVKENDNADSRILFPNPANSTFSIRGIEGVYDLVVYNLNGQKQIEQSITQNDLIDISKKLNINIEISKLIVDKLLKKNLVKL